MYKMLNHIITEGSATYLRKAHNDSEYNASKSHLQTVYLSDYRSVGKIGALISLRHANCRKIDPENL